MSIAERTTEEENVMPTHSQWRLPALSDSQKDEIINARACGLSFDEITSTFRDVFPDYAPDIPEDAFEKLFKYKLGRLLNHSQSNAKYILEAKRNGEIPINVEAIPIVMPHVRLQYYQQLWDETPTRTLQRVVQTADGEKKVYTDNTRDRLVILREYRKELEVLGLLPPQHKDSGSETPSDDEICVIHRPAFQPHLNLLNQTIH